MDKILSIKNLKKIYHTDKEEIIAVNNVSFALENGEFVMIVVQSTQFINPPGVYN